MAIRAGNLVSCVNSTNRVSSSEHSSMGLCPGGFPDMIPFYFVDISAQAPAGSIFKTITVLLIIPKYW